MRFSTASVLARYINVLGWEGNSTKENHLSKEPSFLDKRLS